MRGPLAWDREAQLPGPSTSRLRGPERIYSITALCNEFGVTARTLRFYEEKGMLSPGRRLAVRQFSRTDRGRLKLILLGKRIGLPLQDIAALLALYDKGDGNLAQCRAAQEVFRRQIDVLNRKRDDLEGAMATLTTAIAAVEARLRFAAAQSRPTGAE